MASQKQRKKRASTVTRGESAKRLFCTLSPLDTTEPPTVRQIIAHLYFLRNAKLNCCALQWPIYQVHCGQMWQDSYHLSLHFWQKKCPSRIARTFATNEQRQKSSKKSQAKGVWYSSSRFTWEAGRWRQIHVVVLCNRPRPVYRLSRRTMLWSIQSFEDAQICCRAN